MKWDWSALNHAILTGSGRCLKQMRTPQIVAFGPDAQEGLRGLFGHPTPQNFLPSRIMGLEVKTMQAPGVAVYGR
jgi:hypothetical protein